MSNPCISRWGLNTFWHNFWFNDYNYSYNYNQDKLISQIINIFLFYGVNLTYNIFANRYWYSKNFNQLRIKTYQRWVIRKPNQFGEVMKYSLRQEADSIFLMKLWILKYGNWFVINQYWFQPLKKKKTYSKRENPNHLDNLNIANISTFKLNFSRIKSLLNTNLTMKTFNSSYYNF